MVKKPTETLDELLMRRGEPLTELAKRAGLPPWTLLRLRKRAPARPRVATVKKLADALGIPPEKVLAAIQAGRDGA